MATKHLPFILLTCIPFISFADTPKPATAPVQTTQQAAGPVNCDYHFAKDMKVIDTSLIETWSKNAALQAFNFEPTKLDVQLASLKACFTDQGWQGFNLALQKSGNLQAIKSKQLVVSSESTGNPTLNAIKDNQWKITLPMQVTYHNAEQKLNQSLTINLLITRKSSGDLGIMQIVAVPIKTMQNTPGAQKPTPTP